LQQIGLGSRVAYAVANLLIPEKKRPPLEERSISSPILIDSSEGLVINYARCCHPIPGDHIMGHLSPGRGLVVHQETCKNLDEIRDNQEKCIPLTWSAAVPGEIPCDIKVAMTAKQSIKALLPSPVPEQNVSNDQIRVNERDDHTKVVALTVRVKKRNPLANNMRQIRTLKSVQKVYRIKNKPPLPY